MRVLLVEDDAGDAALLQGELRAHATGCSVCHAVDLADALESVRDDEIDVALLDLSLPDASGLQALEAIVAAAPELPVVVLTDRDDDALALRAIEAGAQDYLLKGDTSPAPLVRSLRYAARRKRDLVEMRRMMAEVRRADEMRSHFLDSVSHELRTPLTPILGYARLLIEQLGHTDERVREALVCIHESGVRLREVVVSILDFQALRAEPIVPNRTPVQVDAVLRDVAASARPAQAVELRTATDDSLSGEVDCDEAQLREILRRVVENATAHTQTGHVMLSAKLVDGELSVAVVDTGPGVPAHDRDRIFSPFYQSEPGLVEGTGLGMGLSHARRIARDLGGDLEHDPRPGGGSRFTVRIPAKGTDGE